MNFAGTTDHRLQITDYRLLPFHPNLPRALLVAKRMEVQAKWSKFRFVPPALLVPGVVIPRFVNTDGVIRLGACATRC